MKERDSQREPCQNHSHPSMTVLTSKAVHHNTNNTILQNYLCKRRVNNQILQSMKRKENSIKETQQRIRELTLGTTDDRTI